MNRVFSNSWPGTLSAGMAESIPSFAGVIGNAAIVGSTLHGSSLTGWPLGIQENQNRWKRSPSAFDRHLYSELGGYQLFDRAGEVPFIYRQYQALLPISKQIGRGTGKCAAFMGLETLAYVISPEPVIEDIKYHSSVHSAFSPSWQSLGWAEVSVSNNSWGQLERFSSSVLNANHGWSELNAANFVVLNDGRSAIRRELVQARRLSIEVKNYAAGRFQCSYPVDDFKWTEKYYQLRTQIKDAGLSLNERWVRFTEEFLADDAMFAVQLLAVGAERFASQRRHSLEKKLSLVTAAKSLLRRLIGRLYQIGNLISSQRRWYLHHGAHPSGTSSFLAEDGSLRVCFQSA